jgi:protein-arginine deiminase
LRYGAASFVAAILVAFPGAAAAATPVARVSADLNHDGVVSTADARLRSDSKAAAIVLPNLDDDARRCPRTRLERFTDEQLAACNDASDNVIDGRKDLADMAPIRVGRWAQAPADARARIAVRASESRRARLFVRRNGIWRSLGSGGALTAAELRNGPQLLLEGRDVIRDRRRWDGRLEVELRVAGRGRVAKDAVRFRVAPLLFQNHTMPLERVFVASRIDDDNDQPESLATPVPKIDEDDRPIGAETFAELNRGGRADYRREWRTALAAGAPHVHFDLLESVNSDRWMQDFYEPGYVSMPGRRGRAHTMTMVIRSATKNRGDENPPPGHLMRQGSRLVFGQLRGPGVGVVQAYDPARMRGLDQKIDSMSSTGNFEAIPPYTNGSARFPNGRMLWGAGGERQPDPVFTRMLRAQGAQRPLVVDTSWLAVGHVDEFVSFVPNDSPRGWTIAVEDPRAGLQLLQRLHDSGAGAARVFDGLARVSESGDDFSRATHTVDELLADPDTADASLDAAQHIDAALAKIEQATGIPDDQVIRAPTFYERQESGLLVSAVPATVNGVPLKPGEFAAPSAHGPIVDGRDAFEADIEQRFAAHGVQVRWVEDWYYAHLLHGEVHCTSNVLRDAGAAAPWWKAP